MFASVNSARAKGRDAKRLGDLKSIESALQLYYDDHGDYPPVTTPGGSLAGWEVSFIPDYLESLVPYFSRVPSDPINFGPPTSMFNPRPDGTFFYMYYNYGSGSWYGCPWSGSFAVGGFRAAEGVDKTKFPKAQCGPQNPPCPLGGISGVCRDWSTEFDYSVLLVR